ncbi:MAG: insulinase family protein [Chloroflexi bacterium]|nr:insulinase family protein [Chloroflexota bacterium]
MALLTLPSSQDITRQQLPNGITLLVRENFSAQSVVVTGMVATGAVNEIPEKQGLAAFTAAALMRGTASRDFASLHDDLESVGASLQISGGMHSVSFGGKCLHEDTPLLLDILQDALRSPVFPENQIERLRGELLTGIQIRQQNTRFMADRRFRELAYPPAHPYHRGLLGEAETIGQITQEDLHTFHREHFGPQDLIVVVVGHIETDAAIRLVSDALSDWANPHQRRTPELPAVPYLNAIHHQSQVIPGKSQADIVLGVPGPLRAAPDFQASRLANNILGIFGMYGRLGLEIREKHGLAYYCYSHLAGGIGPGAWRVIAGVDPTNVNQTVRRIRAEIKRLREELVSPSEMEDSRSQLTGILPLQLESNEGVANTIFAMERYGLGLDYLLTYHDTINALTAEDVQRAVARYWKPDGFALAVAGPELREAIDTSW